MTRIKLIKNKDALLQFILVVIYFVGIIGFSQAKYRDTLLPASGVVLYLSTLAIALASKNKTKFIVFMAIAFLIGYKFTYRHLNLPFTAFSIVSSME